MTRILILMQASDFDEVAEALESASAMAARPDALSFGLVLARAPDEQALAQLFALGHAAYTCAASSTWQAMDTLYQGETYVLAGHPAMRFTRGWDWVLIHTLQEQQRTGHLHCALTGFLPRPEDPVDAVYPVAAERFDNLGRLVLGRGMPLRYARQPQRSAFVHRDFCFAPPSFFCMMTEAAEPAFLAAFQARWHIETLHRPVIRLLWDDPLPPVDVRAADAERAVPFQASFGIDLLQRRLSPVARGGVCTADGDFEVTVPWSVRLQEALRSVKLRRQPATPLCVTAWITLPGQALDESRMRCFRRLAALRDLAVLCFADHETVSRVTLSHPNVLEFKRRYGLNVPDEMIQADYANYVRLCKPFLLVQSREKYMMHSHYMWLDFDYLRFPLYEKAALDWSTLCGDRICLAMVDDVPDTSMVVFPQDRLEPFCREIQAICTTLRASGKPLPQERELYCRLMHDHPDWFSTVIRPVPKQLLYLALTPRGREWRIRS